MELSYKKEDVYSKLNEEQLKEVDTFTTDYIKFLNTAKTEYVCVEEFTKLLDENGFSNINDKETLTYGDKVYFINKEKAIFVAVIGKESLLSGVNIIGAHIDSPRLDLKPMPIYENKGACLLKTQYYGGIKKYQWMSIPLAMYGVVYNEKGEKIKIAIGDKEEDPCFTIADLLPHLASDQLKQKANDFIDPEKMSVLFGGIKDNSAKKDKVKENVLKLLNQKYGIKEIDFARSEIAFVPAFKAKYVGIDSSFIGGYGQDDRVCAYSTIRAMVDLLKEKTEISKTMIAMVVDKEEIGSIGNTSMSTEAFDLFITKLIQKTGEASTNTLEVYYNSKMLSADVSAGVDPVYEEVSDTQNGNIIGCGLAVEKYTGSGGKYNASDANARYVSKVMNIFERNNISFQLGTLGKIGKGGGGTIAYILANKGVDVIDAGTPVLAMHSPFEITSKFDVYMTYKAYMAFFKE